MKLRFIVAVLFLVSAGQIQALTTAEAKAHEGEVATVCGTVASEHTAMRSRGKPTFINLEEPYPREVFTILVWSESREYVGVLPSVGKHVCVRGLIRNYRGVPEMTVLSKDQFITALDQH